MALLPIPEPAPLARTSTINFQFLGIPLQQRVLHDTCGNLVPISSPGLRLDHLTGAKPASRLGLPKIKG